MPSIERVDSRDGHTENVAADRTAVCIVGLGHVGLSLALGFNDAGDAVYGFDIDERRIDALANGVDPSGLFGDEAVRASDVTYQSVPEGIGRADFVIVAVPTPVQNGSSDLSAIDAAGRTIGERLEPGTTVVLESTVPPGTTERRFLPAVETASGLTAGEDFRAGYSPARLSPGDPNSGITDVKKLVSGLTPESLDAVEWLYDRIVEPGVVRTPNMRVAEASKCIENVQRDVNIALANELAQAADAMGVDGQAVIDAASTKWNFHEYRPGIVAGNCLPMDPYHFANAAEREGGSAEIIRTARMVNEAVPSRVVDMTVEAVSQRSRRQSVATDGGATNAEQLLALGLAYKAGTGKPDGRGLGAVLDGLRSRFDVTAFDPRVDDRTIREVFDVPTLDGLDLGGFDVLLVGAAHPEFADLDLETVGREMNESPVVVDVDDLFDRGRDAPANLIYRGL